MTKTLSMESHKNYNLNVKWGLSFFDFQVNHMLYWWFHFKKKIPVNCLFTQWKWTYILDFGPWKRSALKMGYLDKQLSRIQWSCQGRGGPESGTETLAFLVLPSPVALTRATLIGGIKIAPNLNQVTSYSYLTKKHLSWQIGVVDSETPGMGETLFELR
jgi:hypothetical protein